MGYALALMKDKWASSVDPGFRVGFGVDGA